VQTDRHIEFAFSGGRSGSGPATWGQSAKWDVVRGLGTDMARYNVTGGSTLPAPVPVARIAEVVRDLLLRHDSLRTRLRTGDDGALTQTVYARGAVPVVCRRCAPGEVTETSHALYFQLQATPFDGEDEWPVRIGIVEAAGLAHYVIFSLTHTAVDGSGLRNLLADFVELAGGGSVDAIRARDVLQPLEEARFQVSERGRRRDAAARRSWCQKLAVAPVSQFPRYAGRPPAQKFPNAVLNSLALALAMERVAAGFAVSPSAVLLAAAAAVAGRLTGVTDALFQVVVNNRFLPGMAGAVNAVAQEGLFHLARTDEDFPGLARRTFGATMSTHRYAYYDALALDRDVALMRERGDAVGDHSCFINDLRGLMPSLGYARPEPVPLARAREHTTLSWPVEFEPRAGVTFALDAQDAPGSMELAMTADSALIPLPDMEQFLYGIEELVVSHALAHGRD
jgi:hypothetical protein